MPTDPATSQLKEACQLTRVHWAAWVVHKTENWDIQAHYGLAKGQNIALIDFLNHPPHAKWLSNALSNGRSRSKSGQGDLRLACEQINIFPNAQSQAILITGSAPLDHAGKSIFKMLAYSPALPNNASPGLELPLEMAEAAYALPQALQKVLNELVKRLPCDAAYLAIRQGQTFRVETVWGMKPEFKGITLHLTPNAPLGNLAESGEAQVTETPEELYILAPAEALKNPAQAWLGVPLRIGQRIIGLAAFLKTHAEPFSLLDQHRATKLARSAAPLVENAIAFAEAERHLQRLALLNELASAASISLDVESVARRVLRLLRRTFQDSRVGLFLLAPDGTTLQNYGEDRRWSKKHNLVLDHALGVRVLNTGTPLRLENGAFEGSEYALFIPLIYRGTPVGLLGLDSDTPQAFSPQDEQLLLVIASHLAGMIENVHLNEETRHRARNLTAIHHIVQQIVGLLDVREIAQATAVLTAGQFEYDLVLVLLADEKGTMLTVEGGGGKLVGLLADREVYTIPAGGGLEGFDAGFPHFHFGGESEIAVPLRAGQHFLGLMHVERVQADAFNEHDRLVLESLAGVLSSVLMNARRYAQLQERIKAQRLAEKKMVESARLVAVGEIAAGVAHELNNPLTTIAGFTELVLEDLPIEASQREDLTLVLQEAHRARSVVRRLLDFSRQDESLKSLTDINEILGETLALVHHLARTNGVEIRFVSWEGLPPVRMDKGQIKQVVLNLVHNALQAMPRGGSLTLQTTPEKRNDRDWIVMRVLDTGEGIPLELVSRVFEPFFTTKPPGAGTGLGLSISNHIVSEHNGFMEVESELGQGTCFSVWLPVEGISAEVTSDEALDREPQGLDVYSNE